LPEASTTKLYKLCFSENKTFPELHRNLHRHEWDDIHGISIAVILSQLALATLSFRYISVLNLVTKSLSQSRLRSWLSLSDLSYFSASSVTMYVDLAIVILCRFLNGKVWASGPLGLGVWSKPTAIVSHHHLLVPNLPLTTPASWSADTSSS